MSIMNGIRLLKSPKFWIFFIVCLLIMELIGNWLWKSDDLLQESKAWLATQEVIISQIGVIDKIKTKERLYFLGDEKTAPYNRYTFLTYGKKNNAVIIIQVNINEGEDKAFSIAKLRLVKH